MTEKLQDHETIAAAFASGTPFVLFEDAREDGGGGKLFRNPLRTIEIMRGVDVESALDAARLAVDEGCFVAGWLGYEAGLALEQRLSERLRGDGPLGWFGVFADAVRFDHGAVARALPSADGAWLSSPRPRIARADYETAVAQVRRYIVAGDVYQVNMTYRADLALEGDPLAAYAQIRASGGGAWSGIVFDGQSWLLSASPELFFRLMDGEIEARPMKGTAPRRSDPIADEAAIAALQSDPKERAENIMIVDLLRNDISRVARSGTVHVPALLTVESYPTLHTMTSTIRAQKRKELHAVDVLRSLFPCGSVTGAPKIRAMEIIDEIEGDRRGAYTGSIGWMAPNGDAEFNVAIRTLKVRGREAEIGLGSGIVYDSVAAGEWDECLLKGAFVTRRTPQFDLIETMRCSPDGVSHIELHLDRLKRSAQTFGFVFEEVRIRDALREGVARTSEESRMRLALSARGDVAVDLSPLPASPEGTVDAQIAVLPVSSRDFRLRHKTSLRGFYDDARKNAQCFEVVFVDANGFVTEGSFTNVFVPRGGVLLTPPETRGLLPGVLRRALLDSGEAREADLRPEDLADGFLFGNALRGLMPARLAR